ncbi:hypothetical protein U5640_21790 [Streptomyces sp. SS7]|uniref:hypothetical protein n=1 Tax=Streptomyces sp. SS7 TaxID=3108485 RepID=UPI0030EBFE40
MTQPTHPTQPAQPGSQVPPPVPYGRPPGPPADPGAAGDRLSGALLLVGAALALTGSFTTLDTSKETIGSGSSSAAVYRTVAKAWSYTTSVPGQKSHSVTQFDGVPLLVGALLAVTAGVLLLTGSGGRQPLVRVFGVTGAVLLFGTTLTVAVSTVGDGQWDTGGRSTTFGPGFYLLTVACVLGLATTVLTVLATRRPATAPAAVPAPYPQPWATGPVPQAYPQAYPQAPQPPAQPYPQAQSYPPAQQPPPLPHQPPQQPPHQPPAPPAG